MLKSQKVSNTLCNISQNYGQELVLKILEVENYEDLLDSEITATIINDNVLFKW